MSAYPKNFNRALLLPNVRTPLVRTSAVVSQDSMGMASLVKILMSARLICTTAVFMHSAITLLALIPVSVFLALKEMAGHAMTLMNARMELTSVTHMQPVQTQEALMSAAASLGFGEMVKFVEMSTNVWIDHTTAVRMQLVRTLWAPIHARAMTVSMATVVYALTLMSATKEAIFATLMPAVLTSLVLTAAPATKATLEMDDTVKVSTLSTNDEILLTS